MDALVALGARSVPVVAVGDRFVLAQSLADVAELVGITYDATPELAPDELVERLDTVLAAAARLVRQLPADVLDSDVRDRKRSYRELSHHIFRLADGFLEITIEAGESLERDHLNAPAPEAMRSFEDIAGYSDRVRRRLTRWWEAEIDRALTRTVPTYYGPQVLHHVLERITWHTAQHVRQIAAQLSGMGIAPNGPLTADDLAGLPLPEKVWDD